MSMFGPRFYSQAEPNFTGLFRLIDDFDTYAVQNQNGNGRSHHGHQSQPRHLPPFTPKFDLKETETNYELHGELPGIEKKNVHIEFTDPQTILVRGRVERTYEAGTPPSGLLEKKPDEMSGAITQGSGEEHETSSNSSYHHATVEDDVEDGTATATNSTAAPTPATTTSEVAKPSSSNQTSAKAAALKHKYWVAERSIGEFSRTFQFPGRVEPEGVTASLNNGILAVVVPKAKKHESRRIAIN
ncbi:HSP20-like chaperone [Whalleya microplaca]|nr:HSP20-like chaperone [Whalleya microplaca]